MAPSFDTIRQDMDNRSLVRKVQRAVCVLAPKTVELPESLYEGGTLLDLKTLGWLPVGLVTPDGFTFNRETESEDVDALGYVSPVRSDVTRVPRSITFTMLESGRRHIQELKYGTNLSAVTQDAVTGEVVFDEPEMPSDQEYRLLIIGSDGPASENWILGKGYGAVKLATSGSETWGGDSAVSTEMTLNVFTDDEVGTPVRHYLGGTGAVKHKDVLGYTAAV